MLDITAVAQGKKSWNLPRYIIIYYRCKDTHITSMSNNGIVGNLECPLLLRLVLWTQMLHLRERRNGRFSH